MFFSQEHHLGYPIPYLFKTKTCKISLFTKSLHSGIYR